MKTMNNTYNYLLTRTQNIEESISSLNEKTNNLTTSSIATITKDFINLSVTTKRKVFLAEFEVENNNDLSFQINCLIKTSAKQSIEISLYADDTLIAKTTGEYEPGRHNISLFKDHFHHMKNNVKLFIEINSLNKKFISLETTNLIVSGLRKYDANYHYDVIEINGKFLLSYSLNGDVFYKYSEQLESSHSNDSFVFLTNAKQIKFVYSKPAEILFCLRIDTENNLFISTDFALNETFVDSNVLTVSATATNKNVVVTYIKNNSCYVFEIENQIQTPSKPLNQVKKVLIGCYLYFNNYLNKVYLILTDAQNNNYILESLSETSKSSENLYGCFSINISTYGETNEL